MSIHDTIISYVKVAAINIASWVGSLFSFRLLENADEIATILTAIGSFTVSIASFLWIRKQTALLDRKNRNRNQSKSED